MIKTGENTTIFNEAWGKVRAEIPERFLAQFPLLRGDREILDLQKWWGERLEKAIDLIREPGDATGKKDWLVEADEDGVLMTLHRQDGKFWEVVMMTITRKNPDPTKPDFKYASPIKVAIETMMDLPFGPDQTETELPVNGILVAVVDNKGRYLMAAGQETTAKTPKQLIARLPVQSSPGKWALVAGGNTAADPALAMFLRVTGWEAKDLFQRAKALFPLNAEDTNFDVKHNIALLVEVDEDDEAHDQLVADGQMKWMTEIQMRVLSQLGIANAHTLAVLKTIEDWRYFSNQY